VVRHHDRRELWRLDGADQQLDQHQQLVLIGGRENPGNTGNPGYRQQAPTGLLAVAGVSPFGVVTRGIVRYAAFAVGDHITSNDTESSDGSGD
jgi:hypothetical protein